MSYLEMSSWFSRRGLEVASSTPHGLREMMGFFYSSYYVPHLADLRVHFRPKTWLVGKPGPDSATEALLQDLHAHLLENHVKAPIRHGRLRFAFHFYNTAEEVETVLSLLREKLAKTR